MGRAVTASCLPVPPTVRRVEYIEVTYCIQNRDSGIMHNHVALFDAATGQLESDRCTLPS